MALERLRMDISGLKSRLDRHGQDHLLQYWDQLGDDEQSALYEDLDSIDYEEMSHVGLRLHLIIV